MKLEKVINFVSISKDRTNSDLLDYSKKFEEYNNNWRLNVKKIESYYDDQISLYSQNPVDFKDDSFLGQLHEIFTKIVTKIESTEENNFRNPYYLFSNFIEPIKELCNQFLSDPRAIHIIKYTTESTYAFRNIDNLKEIYTTKFEDLKLGLEVTSSNLSEVLDKFK